MSRLPIALYADGGPGIGLGHATRAVGLAHALAHRGHRPHFILPKDDGLRAWIESRSAGASIVVVARGSSDAVLEASRRTGAKALSIDSYALTAAEIASLADALPVLCFDDGARRRLDVDVIVNAAPAAAGSGYRGRPDTQCLLGPAYQIFRPEFDGVTPSRIGPSLDRLFVTLGGDAPSGELLPLMAFLCDAVLDRHPSVRVDLVIGPFVSVAGPAHERLFVHRNPDRVLELMAAADLAVSAGGQTLYELARCGRPTIAVQTGPDQQLNLEGLEAMGAIEYSGRVGSDWLQRLSASIESCFAVDRRRALSVAASRLVDGRGAERVADALLASIRIKQVPA